MSRPLSPVPFSEDGQSKGRSGAGDDQDRIIPKVQRHEMEERCTGRKDSTLPLSLLSSIGPVRKHS